MSIIGLFTLHCGTFYRRIRLLTIDCLCLVLDSLRLSAYLFLADAKQSQDSSLHPSVKVSQKHLIRTVLRQVSCLHLVIVPRGFITDPLTRSKDLQTCRFGVVLYILQHLPAFLVVFWCVWSGLVCVCVRYPVSVLPPVWFALARTCPGPHLGRRQAHRNLGTDPTYPTFQSTLPFFFTLLAFSTIVLPLSILPTSTFLDTLASPSIYCRWLSGSMDLDMSSGSGTPQVQPQAQQQQGESQAQGPPAPSTSTSTSAGGVSFRR